MSPDADIDELYEGLIAGLDDIGLVYIHVVDHSSMGAPAVNPALKARIRAAFNGRYVLSGGYDLARANADLDAKRGDLVAFGRPFISNPDLVSDLRSGHALTAADASTFYTAGEKGYTDY
jgi:N-ethylmaleimide reductase